MAEGKGSGSYNGDRHSIEIGIGFPPKWLGTNAKTGMLGSATANLIYVLLFYVAKN